MLVKLTKLYLLLTILLFFACSSIKITHSYDRSVNFSEFKNYSFSDWANDSNKLLSNPDKEQIEKAFGSEFNRRHLKYLKEGGDLIVSLFIVVEQENFSEEYSNHLISMGFENFSSLSWEKGHSATSYSNYDYSAGTLICGVLDSQSKTLVWQGAAGGAINEETKNREKTIQQVVTQIMSRYPIPPAKD